MPQYQDTGSFFQNAKNWIYGYLPSISREICAIDVKTHLQAYEALKSTRDSMVQDIHDFSRFNEDQKNNLMLQLNVINESLLFEIAPSFFDQCLRTVQSHAGQFELGNRIQEKREQYRNKLKADPTKALQCFRQDVFMQVFRLSADIEASAEKVKKILNYYGPLQNDGKSLEPGLIDPALLVQVKNILNKLNNAINKQRQEQKQTEMYANSSQEERNQNFKIAITELETIFGVTFKNKQSDQNRTQSKNGTNGSIEKTFRQILSFVKKHPLQSIVGGLSVAGGFSLLGKAQAQTTAAVPSFSYLNTQGYGGFNTTEATATMLDPNQWGGSVQVGFTSDCLSGCINNVIISQLAPNGTQVNVIQIKDTVNSQAAFGGAVDSAGAILATGQLSGPSYVGFDMFLTKLNPQTNTLPLKMAYNGGGSEIGMKVVPMPNNEILIYGHTNGFAGNYDLALLVVDATTGALKNAHTYGTSTDDKAYDIYYNAATGKTWLLATTGIGAGGTDVLLVQVNADLSPVPGQAFVVGTGNNDIGQTLIPTPDGGFIVLGSTQVGASNFSGLAFKFNNGTVTWKETVIVNGNPVTNFQSGYLDGNGNVVGVGYTSNTSIAPALVKISAQDGSVISGATVSVNGIASSAFQSLDGGTTYAGYVATASGASELSGKIPPTGQQPNCGSFQGGATVNASNNVTLSLTANPLGFVSANATFTPVSWSPTPTSKNPNRSDLCAPNPYTTNALTTNAQTTQPLTSQALTTQAQTSQQLSTQEITTQEITTQAQTGQQLSTQPLTTQQLTTQQLTTQDQTSQVVTGTSMVQSTGAQTTTNQTSSTTAAGALTTAAMLTNLQSGTSSSSSDSTPPTETPSEDSTPKIAGAAAAGAAALVITTTAICCAVKKKRNKKQRDLESGNSSQRNNEANQQKSHYQEIPLEGLGALPRSGSGDGTTSIMVTPDNTVNPNANGLNKAASSTALRKSTATGTQQTTNNLKDSPNSSPSSSESQLGSSKNTPSGDRKRTSSAKLSKKEKKARESARLSAQQNRNSISADAKTLLTNSDIGSSGYQHEQFVPGLQIWRYLDEKDAKELEKYTKRRVLVPKDTRIPFHFGKGNHAVIYPMYVEGDELAPIRAGKILKLNLPIPVYKELDTKIKELQKDKTKTLTDKLRIVLHYQVIELLKSKKVSFSPSDIQQLDDCLTKNNILRFENLMQEIFERLELQYKREDDLPLYEAYIHTLVNGVQNVMPLQGVFFKETEDNQEICLLMPAAALDGQTFAKYFPNLQNDAGYKVLLMSSADIINPGNITDKTVVLRQETIVRTRGGRQEVQQLMARLIENNKVQEEVVLNLEPEELSTLQFPQNGQSPVLLDPTDNENLINKIVSLCNRAQSYKQVLMGDLMNRMIKAVEDSIYTNKIIQGDITPSNICFEPDGGAYLVDYGCAEEYDGDWMQRGRRNCKYISPDAAGFERKYTPSLKQDLAAAFRSKPHAAASEETNDAYHGPDAQWFALALTFYSMFNGGKSLFDDYEGIDIDPKRLSSVFIAYRDSWSCAAMFNQHPELLNPKEGSPEEVIRGLLGIDDEGKRIRVDLEKVKQMSFIQKNKYLKGKIREEALQKIMDLRNQSLDQTTELQGDQRGDKKYYNNPYNNVKTAAGNYNNNNNSRPASVVAAIAVTDPVAGNPYNNTKADAGLYNNYTPRFKFASGNSVIASPTSQAAAVLPNDYNNNALTTNVATTLPNDYNNNVAGIRGTNFGRST